MAILPSLQTLFSSPQHTSQHEVGVCLLSSQALMSITGPDAQKFLQGQLTCDVNALTIGAVTRGAHCTPKGRAIASFNLAQRAEQDFMLSMPADNLDALHASLSKYIVFSKAKLARLDDWCVLGIMGDGIDDWFQQHNPSNNMALPTVDGYVVKHGDTRYQLWLPQAAAVEQWTALFEQAHVIDPKVWVEADIDEALCDITAATSDMFVPQMFGLGDNNGISFKKGCYTGQEIVARLHFLGKQKRELFTFCLNDETDLSDTMTIGQEVCNDQTRAVGTVVNYANGKGLAVLATTAQDTPLFIGNHAISHSPALTTEAS